MKRNSSDGPTFLLIALLFLVVYALSVPIRNGARLWEAIAVIPQAVLWYVPLLFALPILVSLAYRLRPDWTPRAVPRLDDASPGTLASLADALRRARISPLSRSRVVGQLVRLAVRIVAQRDLVREEDAWVLLRKRCRARDPELGAFLENERLEEMSPEAFRALVERSIEFLEQVNEEV